jgi:hypothetical protein
MPSDRALAVAAAIATARIFVVKAPGPATDQAAPIPPAPEGSQGPSGASQPDGPRSGTTRPDEYPLDTAPNPSQAEVKAVIR